MIRRWLVRLLADAIAEAHRGEPQRIEATIKGDDIALVLARRQRRLGRSA